MSPNLQRAITDLGFTAPSPIQAQTLPILLGEPTDFLGLAATGTGKTAAFSIPLLERLDPKKRVVQALVLCPTRELALQVSGQIDLLGKHMGVRSLPVYGGASYGDQIRGIRSGATVVVGTPGRVCDLMEKGLLSLSALRTLILDEADEMISMGFKENLTTILDASPREESNIWLFSATMSRDVRHVADDYLRDPQQVQVNRTEMVPDAIEQLYYVTSESNKPEILCKLVDAADDFYGLVFCQTKALVCDLTNYMSQRGYRVDCLHGDMDQNARERTMQAYRDRKVTLLICTDVASRGLDVKDVTHVINYSLPRELDNYVHRIGRTARSGKTGTAMSLVTPANRVLVGRIERLTKTRMREGKVPSRKEIGAKKVSRFLAKFQAADAVASARAVELMDADWKAELATLSAEEVAARFLAMQFPDVFGNAAPAEVSMPGARARAGGASRERGIPAPTLSAGPLPPPMVKPRRAAEAAPTPAPAMVAKAPKAAPAKASAPQAAVVQAPVVETAPAPAAADEVATPIAPAPIADSKAPRQPLITLPLEEEEVAPASPAAKVAAPAKAAAPAAAKNGSFDAPYKKKSPWQPRRAEEGESRGYGDRSYGERKYGGGKPAYGSESRGGGGYSDRPYGKRRFDTRPAGAQEDRPANGYGKRPFQSRDSGAGFGHYPDHTARDFSGRPAGGFERKPWGAARKFGGKPAFEDRGGAGGDRPHSFAKRGPKPFRKDGWVKDRPQRGH